jgi:hypothetical protein
MEKNDTLQVEKDVWTLTTALPKAENKILMSKLIALVKTSIFLK